MASFILIISVIILIIMFLYFLFVVYRNYKVDKLDAAKRKNIHDYEQVFGKLISKKEIKEKPLLEKTAEKEEKKQEIPRQETEGFFYLEAENSEFFNRSKLNFIRRYLSRRIAKKYPDKVVLVRFELNNGRYREFTVKESLEGFVYKKKRYIFDLEHKYYVIDSNLWCYDFHESLSLPVKNEYVLKPEYRKIMDQSAFKDLIRDIQAKAKKENLKPVFNRIPVDEIKESIKETQVTEVENALNPSVLQRHMESDFIRSILQGATMGKIFKIMLIIVMIILFVQLIDVTVDLYDSGLFDKLNLGGGGE